MHGAAPCGSFFVTRCGGSISLERPKIFLQYRAGQVGRGSALDARGRHHSIYGEECPRAASPPSHPHPLSPHPRAHISPLWPPEWQYHCCHRQSPTSRDGRGGGGGRWDAAIRGGGGQQAEECGVTSPPVPQQRRQTAAPCPPAAFCDSNDAPHSARPPRVRVFARGGSGTRRGSGDVSGPGPARPSRHLAVDSKGWRGRPA